MRLLGALAAAAAVVGLVAYFRLNGLVRDAIVRYASQATQTAVTVRSVSISPLSGTGSLRGLAIANPSGYSKESALSVEDIRIRISPASLLTGTVVVNEVLVASPWIRWEIRVGESNLGRLKRTLEGPPAPPAKGKKAAEGPGRKVIVEHFILKDARVKVTSAVGGASEMTLPDLHLRDIGKKGGGATVKDVLSQVLSATFRAVMESGSGSALQSAGASVLDKLGGLFKKKR